MSIVAYTIELLEPLLATGMTGDPNTKRSLAFIPGSMLRGAAIGLYLQQKAPLVGDAAATLDNDDAAERRYFLSEQTRFLNAYSLVDTTGYGDRQRVLPTPRSWLADKKAHWSAARKGQSSVTFNDFAVTPRAVDGVQWTALKDDFFTLSAGRLLLHSPTRRVALHTARERKMGRATTAEGAVFYYDALAAGQRFHGFILTASDDDATYLANLLHDQEWTLGASRSAGYGRVLISAEAIGEVWAGEWPPLATTEEDDWSADEADNVANSILQPGAILRILCLSHCIVRTDEGHFTADLGAALCRQLALSPGALQPAPEQTHRTMLKVGGFNRTWGLPTNQSQAITAGSVFVYRLTQPLAVTQLHALENVGIGEQRLDGYGRVVVNRLNDPSYTYSDQREIELPDNEPAIADDDPALPLLQRMGQRLLRLEWERELVSKIQATTFAGDSIQQQTWSLANFIATTGRDQCYTNVPYTSEIKKRQSPKQTMSKSQLSRLRLVVRTALEQLAANPPSLPILAVGQDSAEAQQQQAAARQAAYQPVLHFLDMLRPTARDKLRRTRLFNPQGPRLDAWLQERLHKPFFGSHTPPSVRLGSVPITAPPMWDLEYTLRWIDGVLAQAAKQMASAEAAIGLDDEGVAQ
jgi:CRISPR-associated protein Csx10